MDRLKPNKPSKKWYHRTLWLAGKLVALAVVGWVLLFYGLLPISAYISKNARFHGGSLSRIVLIFGIIALSISALVWFVVYLVRRWKKGATVTATASPKKRTWWKWAFFWILLACFVLPTITRWILIRQMYGRFPHYNPDLVCTPDRSTSDDLHDRTDVTKLTIDLKRDGSHEGCWGYNLSIPNDFLQKGFWIWKSAAKNDPSATGDYAAVRVNNDTPAPPRGDETPWFSETNLRVFSAGGDIGKCRLPAKSCTLSFQGRGRVYLCRADNKNCKPPTFN